MDKTNGNVDSVIYYTKFGGLFVIIKAAKYLSSSVTIDGYGTYNTGLIIPSGIRPSGNFKTIGLGKNSSNKWIHFYVQITTDGVVNILNESNESIVLSSYTFDTSYEVQK